MGKRIRIDKGVDDPIIERITFTCQDKSKPGSLEIHFRSGIVYKYKDVLKWSVDMLFQNNVFIAHQYNKYIHGSYNVDKRIKTEKYKKLIQIERKKQYLAKNNAARRARKQKAREAKQKELVNA